MLVYATRLWFDSSAGLNGPLQVVSKWLSRKVGRQLVLERFLEGVDRTFDGVHKVKSIAALDGLPRAVSIVYSHPDDRVWGRHWDTEIGIRQITDSAPVECSILLSTNEISTRVAGDVQASRPGLVAELVRRCPIDPQTQGVSIHELDQASAEGFRHNVLDVKRRHSLVVLSSDGQGKHLAEPERLLSMVLGLADVVVVSTKADSFWLARVIGKEYVPYGGAAKLIFPLIRRFEGGGAPVWTLTLKDAEKLAGRGRTVLDELFSLVVHRSNLPLSLTHISPSVVREIHLKRQLEHRRDAASRTGNLEEYSRFLEEYAAGLEEEKKEAAGLVESLEKLVAVQDDRERQLSFEHESLKQRLAEAGRGDSREDRAAEESEGLAQAVLAGIERGPTPEQALRIIEHLFPERIVILPSAWRAARESESFKHRGQLYELLHILATEYWSALTAGQPDSEAKKPLGASYAAKESERVANNDGALSRRTFDYRGRPVEMVKHLKIGRKDSISETIRVHFEWFAEDRQIVVGHCGRHIPFK